MRIHDVNISSTFIKRLLVKIRFELEEYDFNDNSNSSLSTSSLKFVELFSRLLSFKTKKSKRLQTKSCHIDHEISDREMLSLVGFSRSSFSSLLDKKTLATVDDKITNHSLLEQNEKNNDINDDGKINNNYGIFVIIIYIFLLANFSIFF